MSGVEESASMTEHDQLPTVAEIHNRDKMSKQSGEHPKGRGRRMVLAIATIIVFVCAVVAIVVTTTRNKSKVTDRMESAMKILTEVSLAQDLVKNNTPQNQALQWIVRKDQLKLPIPSSLDDTDANTFIERYVAALLFYTMGGSNWVQNFNFLSKDEICEWNALTLLSTGLYKHGILCKEGSKSAAALLMDSNNLRGPLPREIAYMTNLQYTSMGSNFLSGNIPSEIGQLQNLLVASFNFNDFAGSIPTIFGNLPKLEYLRLGGNSYTGPIPKEFGSLKNLKSLDMGQITYLNGNIPDELRNLKKLEKLFLSYTSIEGPIPDWIGMLSNLKELSLSNTKMTSSIPSSFSNLWQLKYLFLDDNSFTGDLDALQYLLNLEYVFLEDNEFNHNIQSNFLSSSQSLRVFDGSNNQLKGSVPQKLFEKVNLTLLDLHGNNLDSSLPKFPVNSALQYLSLHDNNLQNAIPQSISNLLSLRHLDLSSNQFTGDIPVGISELLGLTYLFLAGNTFEQNPIPDLRNLTRLRELSLKRTGRNGEIPEWIGDMKELILLDLDNNALVGKIPDSISKLKEKLVFLLLNDNQLTGTVPASLYEFEKLRILLIEENNISGLGDAFCDVLSGGLAKPTSIFTGNCDKYDCPCCTECCASSDVCNGGNDFLASQDLLWEYGYRREDFVFSNDTVFTYNQFGNFLNR